MDDVLLFAGGAACCWAIDLCVRWLNRRRDAAARARAEVVIARHRLSVLLYLPSVGIDDTELRGALASPAFAGRIIVDRDGRIVGKVAGRLPQEPYLRLVVSND